jgi:hypothetical protein
MHTNAKTGRCDPGRDRLAELLRCSTDSVDRALNELVQFGAVEKRNGHGASHATNRYRVHFASPGQHRGRAKVATLSQVRRGADVVERQLRGHAERNSAPVRHELEEANQSGTSNGVVDSSDVVVDSASLDHGDGRKSFTNREPDGFADAVAGLILTGPQRLELASAFEVANERRYAGGSNEKPM